MSKEIRVKAEKLRTLLREYGAVAIAFSGGVDSTFLAAAAADALGAENVLAVTARGRAFPSSEYDLSQELAENMRLRSITLELNELEVPEFVENTPDRCYFCKRTIFTKILDAAAREGFDTVCDGANKSDVTDHRPGSKATRELGVKSPLKEVGLIKSEIRKLSREMDLPTWDNPSRACLASRFPYGDRITPEGLSRVNDAEEYIMSLGFRQFRVRNHGNLARIEIAPDEMSRILDAGLMNDVASHLKKLGYSYVSLDMEGYRMGSLNEVL